MYDRSKRTKLHRLSSLGGVILLIGLLLLTLTLICVIGNIFPTALLGLVLWLGFVLIVLPEILACWEEFRGRR